MNIEQEINSLKANPILFKTDMVRAIREDRKTETRRIIKPQPIFDRNYMGNRKIKINKNHYISINYITKSPYGKPGEYLWVRETWREEFFTVDHTQRYDHKYYYKSDNKKFYSSYGEEKIFKWKSSIYMPKSACRLILKIEDLGVERIQDITEESAINEGILSSSFDVGEYEEVGYYIYGSKNDWDVNPINSFQSLYISINGQKSWDKNIFVWRIKFSKYIQM
jgi:hypothetical protein